MKTETKLAIAGAALFAFGISDYADACLLGLSFVGYGSVFYYTDRVCTKTCVLTHIKAGTIAELQAVPGPGYTLAYWSQGCRQSTAPRTFCRTMVTPKMKRVRAYFKRTLPMLVNKDGEPMGMATRQGYSGSSGWGTVTVTLATDYHITVDVTGDIAWPTSNSTSRVYWSGTNCSGIAAVENMPAGRIFSAVDDEPNGLRATYKDLPLLKEFTTWSLSEADGGCVSLPGLHASDWFREVFFLSPFGTRDRETGLLLDDLRGAKVAR